MIKWTMIFLFFLSSVVFGTQASQESIPFEEIDVCNSNNNAFQPGEILTYKIYYNWGVIWLGAGEVKFQVQETENNYLYKAVGKSFPSYDWIFEVDDHFYSYVDKETLLPVRAKRDIDEDGYIIHNDIRFDQDNKFASSTLIVNDKEPKVIEKEYDDCMFDILSVIYSLRNIDKSRLKRGDIIPFNMMMDDETYDLKMEYIGDVGVKYVKNLGDFKAVKISPSVIKGRVFDKNERMQVWVSNDKNNVPLIIESPLAVGKIKVILQGYEGLRYPLNEVE